MSGGAYPALGFDPAPGDVYEVATLVSVLRSVGAELAGVRAQLRSIGNVQGAWVGEAATAFVGQLGELPSYLNRAEMSTDSAYRALSTWQHELEDFERRGRVYEQRAEQARQQVTSARAALNTLPQATGQMTDRQAAELTQRTQAAQRAYNAADDELAQILQAARRMLDEHQALASQVAARVRDAADHAPPEPGLFESVGDMLGEVGDFFANIADSIATWFQEHAELFKHIGDLLADLALVVGIAAVVVGLLVAGPAGWYLLVAAGALSLGALATHGTAKASGADVSATTLVLDGLGALSAGAGLVGLRIAASGARTAQAGGTTMASVRWGRPWLTNVGTKLRGAGTIGKGKMVEFGGKTVQRAGDTVTVGSSGASIGTELYNRGPSWKDIPVVGSAANLIDYAVDDSPETAQGSGSVDSAGRAFADTAAAQRTPARSAAGG